jgi:glycosyltransferase involved in cell wall biosynthesis
MNLGIVCQRASTGGWRYTLMLAGAIRRLDTRTSITIYHGNELPSSAAEEIRAADVMARHLPTFSTPRHGVHKRRCGIRAVDRPLNAIREAYKASLNRKRMAKFVQCLNRHDLVHFTWPYGIEPPSVAVPMSFIPHDFIYAHEFGTPLYTQEQWLTTRRLQQRWLDVATPVVSSAFIASELRRTFPGHVDPVEVIYLSTLNPPVARAGIEPNDAADLRRLHAPDRYILCPNNLNPHKNLTTLLAALWHVRQAGEAIKLVAVGHGTDGIRAKLNCPLYGDRVGPMDDYDVLGMGLVNDTDLSILIRNAELVINPSVCEAGSGSGVDAWSTGCPVALADIPAFRDQVRFLGTQAEFFDPRDPRDTARAILDMVRQPMRFKLAAEQSKAAMEKYTWEHVACHYLAFFERNRSRGPTS